MINITASDHQPEGDESKHDIQTQTLGEKIYAEKLNKYHAKVDKLLVGLFCVQWPLAVVLAFLITPTTWAGTNSSIHVHVYLAIGLGAISTLFPLWLARKRPGELVTRIVIGASTMLFTGLFIHLSGGRDEGHFHFFMMMAFVTLYFDWRVLLTAVAVGAADHILRAVMFPVSIFGVLESPWFQLFRHVGWTVFEGSVLLYAANLIDREKRDAALQLAVSQLSESRISTLMEERRLISEQRDERDLELRKATIEREAEESRQRDIVAEAQKRDVEEAKHLASQVDALLVTVSEAAAGNLNAYVSVRGDDGVGQVGNALEKMLESLRDNFGHISQCAVALSASADELSDTSSALNKDAMDTNDQVKRVSLSAEQVNEGVQNTASSTEQMNTAIREVAQCAADAVKVGQEAVVLASEATTTVEQLAVSSIGIGDVLKVITSIAEQTNLLALNATIEAARAGDMGKGFAVVANEVKELAKETALATDEISKRIAAIQSDAGNAGHSIEKISAIVEQINHYQITVASAVEEQTATTREIGNSVKSCASGSDKINAGIESITEKVVRNGESAEHVDSASTTLKGVVQQLNTLLAIYSQDDRGRQALSSRAASARS